MNLDVTVRAIGVLGILIVLRTSRLLGAHAMRYAVACEAKLPNPAGDQQTWIGGAVRGMASDAPLGFHRRMLIDKRPLLVDVALDAGSIRAGS